jgi:hypothetical protein
MSYLARHTEAAGWLIAADYRGLDHVGMAEEVRAEAPPRGCSASRGRASCRRAAPARSGGIIGPRRTAGWRSADVVYRTGDLARCSVSGPVPA